MDDDWGFSVEEMASLEENAKRRVAQRRGSASAASPLNSPSKGRSLPSSIFSSPTKKGLQRPITVKLFQDQPGRIGLETQYHPALVAALKTVPGHEWDQIRRVWTYPEDKLELLLAAIQSLSTVSTDINIIPPLHYPRAQQGWNVGSLSFQSGLSEPQQGCSSTSGGFSPNSTCSKRPVTATVQLYLMDADIIAAKNPYHESGLVVTARNMGMSNLLIGDQEDAIFVQSIKEACQTISGRAWNAEERAWTFPKSSFEELVQTLRRVRNPLLEIEATPPLKLPEPSNSADKVDFLARSPRQGASSSVSPRVALWPPAGKQVDKQRMQIQAQGSSEVQAPSIKVSVKLSFHSSGNVAAKCEYEPRLVAALKTISKAEWHARERVWVFPVSSLQEAETKLSSIDGVIVNVEHLERLVTRALEACSTMPDLRERYDNIPHELEKRLLPFQRDGVKYALQHGGRSLIADEMGLGKTLQAIAFTTCFQDEWPVLVITPSSLRLHWAAMINQWLNVSPADILVIMSSCYRANREGFNIVQSTTGNKAIRLDGLFNILSYELVTKLQDEIAQTDFKIIIADEAHYLKNAQAKRTLASVPLLQRCKYALLLSGTPALSRPIELYKQLEALQPGTYKNVHEYGKRYCMGGHFGVYQGSSNCEELHNLMKSTVMIRRLKKDVLSELPQKRRQQIYLSLDEKGMKQIRALFFELDTVKRDIKGSKSQEDADRLRYAERQLISKIYTESAEVKLPAVQDYLSTVVEADCKFLVFAHHKSLLDGIEQFLVKKKVLYIRIDGSTESSLRQGLVNKFQETDNVKAAVLGIRAAGVGLNFTAASTVIFAEMSWTPGDLVQAEDRAHRIGQASSVNVYYLHAHDTVDDLIWDSVQHKLENVGQVLDGKEDSLHVASSQKHCSLPAGQSTLKAFLRPCSSPPAHTTPPRQSSLKAFFHPCSSPPAHDVNQAENRVQKKRKLFTSDEGSDD